MDAIASRTSFGAGRRNDEPIDHPVLDAIRHANAARQRALADLAANQLRTVGAGSHYVDLFAEEGDAVWVGVHFGSRGLGHKTATQYLALAGEHPGGMDAAPSLLSVDSALHRGDAARRRVRLRGPQRRRRAAFFSTVHGAGRRMSRTQARARRAGPG